MGRCELVNAAEGTKKRKGKGSAFQTISAVHRVDILVFHRVHNFFKEIAIFILCSLRNVFAEFVHVKYK